jgi:hypothetical protein
MLVELLRLSGGAELMRRWVAALLNVPAVEREGVIRAVEQRIAEEYEMPQISRASAVSIAQSQPVYDIALPAVQREGYTEVVVRSYAQAEARPKKKKKRRSGGSAA